MEAADALFKRWGRNIKQARGTYWKQKDLAAVCGIEPSYLCNIEAGRRVPNDRVKLALAGALRKRVDELFPWPEEIPPFPSLLKQAA